MLSTTPLTKKKDIKLKTNAQQRLYRTEYILNGVLVINHGISENRKFPYFWQRVELSHEISQILSYIPTSAELTQTVLALLVSSPSPPHWVLSIDETAVSEVLETLETPKKLFQVTPWWDSSFSDGSQS